jgi:hypothetical protein
MVLQATLRRSVRVWLLSLGLLMSFAARFKRGNLGIHRARDRQCRLRRHVAVADAIIDRRLRAVPGMWSAGAEKRPLLAEQRTAAKPDLSLDPTGAALAKGTACVAKGRDILPSYTCRA